MKLVFVGFRQTKGTCSPSTILLLRRAEYRTTGARLPKCNSPKDSKPLRKRRQSRPRSTEDGRFSNRTRLHYLAGRDDNKLSFERQDEIARLSGAASPEDLMRSYYRAVRTI